MKGDNSIVVNLNNYGHSYGIVHKAVIKKGWKLATKQGEFWDIGWSDSNKVVQSVAKMANHRFLGPVQRINHFPANKHIYRKVLHFTDHNMLLTAAVQDLLGHNLNMMARLSPEVFNFHPRTWNLPKDREQLEKDMERPDAPSVYITKPKGSIQGRGIRLTANPLKKAENDVVQQYVSDPLLIDGFKFDLRIYVLLASIEPLQIHLFGDGLVRLCTSQYAPPIPDNFASAKMHLTNFAINKKSKNFVKSAAEDEGSKRSIASWLRSMADEGHDSEGIWDSISDMMIKSIIAVQPAISKGYQELVAGLGPINDGTPRQGSLCFEVFGFDVMLDNQLRPFLLEVNHTPSFLGGTKLDNSIKSKVVQGALRIIQPSSMLSKKSTMLAAVREARISIGVRAVNYLYSVFATQN